VITANTLHSIATSARTFVLAGTLIAASVLPTASLVYADAGDPTPAVSQPVLPAERAFDVDPAGGLIGIEAVVVAHADGAPLLEEASLTATVLETLPEGTNVLLRIDMVDTVYSADGEIRWWPVDVDGTYGWIDGRSLMSPQDFAVWSAPSDGTKAGIPTTSRTPFDYRGELEGATAQVDADGQGLKMRSEPNSNAEALASIPEGTIIDLRIDMVDTVYDSAGTRWWPVSYQGQDGWVSGFYLIHPGSEPQTATTPLTSTRSTSPQPPESVQLEGDFVYVAGDWAVVRTSDEGRTNLYGSNSTSASVTGTIPHMALVEVLAQAGGGWYEVRWDTSQGFIPGDLLTAGTAPRRASDPVPPAPTPVPAAVSTETTSSLAIDPLVAGDIAQIDSDSSAGVNVRSAAGIDQDAVGFLDDGSQVEVLEGPNADSRGTEWYLVRAGNELEGWVRADLLNQVVATTDSAIPASTEVSEAGWILPLANFRFTQDYGCSSLGFYSYDPNWGCAVHDGVDMAAPQGTPLLAVADGLVVVSGWCDCGLGYYVELDHGNGLHTIYGHMASQPPVNVGDRVTQGQEIGPVGSTGLSTGPHVHFMVRENGVTVDPKNYLPPIRSTSGN
jgi:murein DD-endopeptidase MepM/ murein hydrolase activator NlpD